MIHIADLCKRSLPAIVLLVAAGTCTAQTGQVPADVGTTSYPVNANGKESSKQANGKQIIKAPPADFYPYYLADPRSARTVIALMGMFDSDIEDAGGVRFGNSIGKRFGVVRFGDERAYEAWQFDIELGYFGQFDIENSLNNIGWDGVYGLHLSRRLSPDLFVRFSNLHDSAHIGDEYIEETGRERIEYTREELTAGMAWLPKPASTLYTELGWAWDLNGDQQRWRAQGGADYHGAHDDLYLGLPWYAATDITLYEERDWEPAVSLHLGLIYATGRESERYRFAVEAYRGRSPMGEFAFEDESYLSIGVHYDH